MLQPLVYLTCEIKGRDLPSRLLIGSYLVARGYHVIVGQQWAIFSNIRQCPHGVVLFKTANKMQADWMAEARAHGHVAIASDEECLASSPSDYARLTHPDAIHACHDYLAQNELHAAAIRAAYPEAAPKVHVVGNARVDILRAARPKRPLDEPYILINTSFGRINSIVGDRQKAIDWWLQNSGHQPNEETRRMVKERLSFEDRAFAETNALIDWLLANTIKKIVVRPHPSERVETWTAKYAASSPRVLIVPKSDPAAWIKHAEFMVHNESTTGVEAAVLGTPAINLSPPSDWGDRLIVSEANITAPTAAEAAAVISESFRTKKWPSPKISADDAFPTGGALKAAEAIMRHLPHPDVPQTGFQWSLIQRTDLQREKFTATLEEVRAQVGCEVGQIDDSLFMLAPGP